MSLTVKGLLILALAGIGFVAISFGVIGHYFAPAFAELEQRQADQKATLLHDLLEEEVQQIAAFTQEWAAWDDTYRFMAEPEEAFIHGDVVFASFLEHKINLFGLYDAGGNLVWGVAFDVEREAEVDPAKALGPAFRAFPDLLALQAGKPRAGYLGLKDRIYIFASHQVTTTNKSAPPVGTLVLGKFLDGNLRGEFTKKMGGSFSIWPLSKEESVPPEASAQIEKLSAESPTSVRFSSDRTMEVYAWLPDLRDSFSLLARAELPRDTGRLGQDRLNAALTALLVASVALFFLLLILFQGAIFSPISRLARRAALIEHEGDFSQRLLSKRRDDVGVLARSFDALLGRLDGVASAQQTPVRRQPARPAPNTKAADSTFRRLEPDAPRLDGDPNGVFLEAAVLKAVSKFSSPVISQSDIAVHSKVGELPGVPGSPDDYVKLFSYLLKKCAQHIEEKSINRPEITFTAATQLQQGGDIAHLRVRHNGKGIDRDELPREFRPAPGEEMDSDKAMAAWCKDYIESLGGRIYAESAGLEHGVTYHIMLPTNFNS